MATYGANILPSEAAYYTLDNATISGGVLSIQAGGSAVYSVPQSVLAKLTETFKVSMLASTHSYIPTLFMNLNARTTDGTTYNCTCVPTTLANEVYSVEVPMAASEYDYFYVTIRSLQDASITLWELCPQTLADIQVIIDGVQQSLPRLLFDYNAKPFEIGANEATIALITCNLLQQTDIQGHLLMAYNASSTCTLTLRFKDNEATELFAPVLYDIHAGRGTIGVPHAYLKRLGGFHNFIVTAQCSRGTISVDTRDMLFTIDGGYLAARTIDIGANISDVTIQNNATDSKPSFIWIISVEAGELLVRRREYSTAASGVTFEPMYSLGEAIDGAIEFDGDWAIDMDNADTLYRLNTYEKPYCFIIDPDNNLYVQRGDVIASRTLLDTGVSNVSACRGYKSQLYPEQDQGLIVLYIKNGVAWYRQYAYDVTTSNYIWYAAVQVTGFVGIVLSAQVHRLNDYRVGFAITTETENYWMISSRTYVGQAYKPEIIYMSPTQYATVGLIPANDIPIVTVSGALSDDRLTITATFSHDIRCVGYSPLECLTMPAALQDIVDTVEVVENTIVITVEEALYAPYTISLSPEYLWQYKLGNNWLTIPSALSYTYDPYGHLSNTSDMGTVAMNVGTMTASIALEPSRTPSTSQSDAATFDPTVTATITQTPINYQTGAYEDTITLDPSITTTITLLLVGEQPI